MAGRIPWGEKSLEEVKLLMTKRMALAVATATVGWHNKGWGFDNASTTMIPSTTMKMTRIATKKEGGWDSLPPW
jgi:hypothetical protein